MPADPVLYATIQTRDQFFQIALQLLEQDSGKKAAEDIPAYGIIALMEDGPSLEHRFYVYDLVKQIKAVFDLNNIINRGILEGYR